MVDGQAMIGVGVGRSTDAKNMPPRRSVSSALSKRCDNRCVGLWYRMPSAIAHGWVEQHAVQRHLAVEHAGSDRPSPRWKLAGGHLIQRHGDGEALGIEIPAWG